MFLPGESHGQMTLVACSPWGRKESDRTEWLTHTLRHHHARLPIRSPGIMWVSSRYPSSVHPPSVGAKAAVSHTLCSFLSSYLDFPGDSVVKSLPANAGEMGFNPCIWTIPWSRKWQPAPVFLPGKFYGQRSLAGHSPWCHKRVWHDLATKQCLKSENESRSVVWNSLQSMELL